MNQMSTPAESGADDPWSVPLAELDPSRGTIFQAGLHHKYFTRLRQEDPVHYTPRSAFGPFWSITKFDDIVAVETNPKIFSSAGNIFIGEQLDGFAPPMFMASDPPVHAPQRKAVMPALAPQRLSELESIIRERIVDIINSLPRDETFNWVDRVSKEVTTQMLAILLDDCPGGGRSA